MPTRAPNTETSLTAMTIIHERTSSPCDDGIHPHHSSDNAKRRNQHSAISHQSTLPVLGRTKNSRSISETLSKRPSRANTNVDTQKGTILKTMSPSVIGPIVQEDVRSYFVFVARSNTTKHLPRGEKLFTELRMLPHYGDVAASRKGKDFFPLVLFLPPCSMLRGRFAGHADDVLQSSN